MHLDRDSRSARRRPAQLVDAETGAHRWTERYDRKLDDVFAIQDEVVRSIAPLLVAHVTKAEVERTLLKPPTTWQAYHYFMRGLDLHLSYQSSQEVPVLREARRLLEQSISIDPTYARPYSALAVRICHPGSIMATTISFGLLPWNAPTDLPATLSSLTLNLPMSRRRLPTF